MIGVVASDPKRFEVEENKLRQVTRMLQTIEGTVLEGTIFEVRAQTAVLAHLWRRLPVCHCSPRAIVRVPTIACTNRTVWSKSTTLKTF
jgi:hypothetical protein